MLVGIVGTQITDLLADGLNVSLDASTAAIFFVWHRVEGTLSIDTIVTPRPELFSCAAVLCTFAPRTAAGDLATEALGLGFTRRATNTALERQPPIVPRSILRERMMDVVVRSTPSSVPIWSSRSLSRSGESARSHAT